MKPPGPDDLERFKALISDLHAAMCRKDSEFVRRMTSDFPRTAACGLSLGALKAHSSRMGFWLGIVAGLRIQHPDQAQAIDEVVASCRLEMERVMNKVKTVAEKRP